MPWTRTQLIATLRELGIRPKKGFGQNFLLDPNFLEAIVDEAAVDGRTSVIEIGPGPGNLTERLADRARHVWAIELDAEILEVARRAVEGRANVTLIHGDGAEFGRLVPAGPHERLVVVSNLPYNEYQRILLSLLDAPLPVEAHYLMLQRDVYDRLAAGPGDRRYGPMSVLVQGLCELRLLRRANPELFYPRPRVDSAFFRLRPRRRPERPVAVLEGALRTLFLGRRKQLGAVVRRLGLSVEDPAWLRQRVEDLPPEELLQLAGRLR